MKAVREQFCSACATHVDHVYIWDPDGVQAQKAAGVDAVIMDDVGRLARATGKAASAFNRPLRSPSSFQVRAARH